MYWLEMTQWVKLEQRKKLYPMEIMSWICLDLHTTKNLWIKKEVRQKNTWFNVREELKKQLPKHFIDFGWNKYYSCYLQDIDSLPPTSSVVKGHICRGAFSLRYKCSITGVMKSFLQDFPEEKWWHIVFECTNLSRTCVCYQIKLLQHVTAILIAWRSITIVSTVEETCMIFCHGKKTKPLPAWM